MTDCKHEYTTIVVRGNARAHLGEAVCGMPIVVLAAGDYTLKLEQLQKENAELKDRIERAENCLVCAAIAPLDEVVQSTMDILTEGE